MSLNFFTSNTQKTDATLSFKSVLENITDKEEMLPLDIDRFIQQESIHLDQHQDFYKAENKEIDPPKSLSKENDFNQQDTRVLVNSLLELSKTMPEIKSKALEYNDKIKAALDQNDYTIQDINQINI